MKEYIPGKEVKPGETFEFMGRRYRAVIGSDCEHCDLNSGPGCGSIPCTDIERKDGRDIQFEEVE